MKRFVIKNYPETFPKGTDDNEDIIMRIDPQSNLSDVIDSFERFLKACGYYFDGHLEIVPEFSNEENNNGGDGEDEF